ncbi:ParA family protein [Desulfurococcus mucosus]|uniref:AAA domain-containing protein n=1 Tax=Desulfurococcus mucosus (strain ATCC 35584 / DSM 2162 / JCM 9187 / O7/1) TaxID=765177 RepID=E8R8D0_DESM0|nr:ParA family protein [Desulfurococcus mucosus]ADV64756.1 hypothetical protein Desmu_0440 [Desulfurococcus mucosus DSM 2162]
MPNVITVTNQKGGTGKTTLSALLGIGLASKGYNVLLIDLDPQAHLSSLFVKITNLENVSDGAIEMAQDLRFNIRPINIGTRGRLGLIASGLNYIIKVYRGMIPSTDPYAIYKRIEREPAITRNYDYVICDTPPELFPPTIWGLFAADYIIIPSNLEELSILGTKLLIKEVLPEVIMYSKKNVRVLGMALINISKKYGQDTFNKLNDALTRFIRNLPVPVRERFYARPLFQARIHRHEELKDLPYRPRRWELPLKRVVDRSAELRIEVQSFVDELISRMSNFAGLQ